MNEPIIELDINNLYAKVGFNVYSTKPLHWGFNSSYTFTIEVRVNHSYLNIGLDSKQVLDMILIACLSISDHISRC
jgi:hypothetical protein